MEMHHGVHSHSQMQRAKRQASSCSLYGQPATGTTVNAYEATTITWDCSCMGTAVKDIDITLYYYGGGALHAWTDVPCSDNSLTTTFKPNWWNSTLSAELQLQITESDQPVWATTTGLGPSFNVAWNGTTPASISAGNGTQTGVSIESIRANDETGGIAGGKLAAAVTVPLLAAAIAIAAYIFYSRRKVKTDRKRWSAYVDQRMSHYSSAPESFTQEGRPSMHSRVQSHYSNVLGSPDKSGMTGATMTQTGSGRPSLASRPISGYSIASNGNNFAGVGSNNVRMPPMAAQIPAMSNEGHAADAAGPFGDMHSRGYSTSGISAVGSHAEGRPASSFYALDGHTGMDTPTSAGSDPTRKHYGNNKSITSTGRPTSEFARPQGTGVGDRVSRVSFADSSFTGKETTGGNRRSSYFANGPGTASSPNAHRYRASQGNSISGNSIFNMYGGGGKDAPAMPRIPIPAVFNKDRDVTKGVEASTARSLSAEDLAGIVVNNNAPGVYSPESFETAALPASRSADENLESMTSGGDQFLAVGDSNNSNKKHNITISTSMPRLANPQGRQSILSPDDMLRAYASKTAIAGPSPRPLLSGQQDLTSSMSVPTMSLRNNETNISSAQRPDTFMSDYSKYPDEDLEEFVSVHPTHTLQHQEQDNQGDEGSTSGKKGIFNTKFKFGNSSK